MLLGSCVLNGVASVNTFDYVSAADWTAGDTVSLYIQLLDLSLDRPGGRRYIPLAGATLEVTLDSIDSAKRIVRAASQPYSQDSSIWLVSILSTDTIRGTVNLRLKLTEAGKVTRGTSETAVRIHAVGGL